MWCAGRGARISASALTAAPGCCTTTTWGSIDSVDANLLRALLARGLTPVICPPIAAEDGTAINVDGDRLAAEIAVALGATRLMVFADTPVCSATPATRRL